MAKPEIMAAFTTDLKKLAFDKQKMPPIEKAVETLEVINKILINFENFREHNIE